MLQTDMMLALTTRSRGFSPFSWPARSSPTLGFWRSTPESHLTFSGNSFGTDDRVVAKTVLDALDAYCLVREAPRPLVAPTISALTIVLDALGNVELEWDRSGAWMVATLWSHGGNCLC